MKAIIEKVKGYADLIWSKTGICAGSSRRIMTYIRENIPTSFRYNEEIYNKRGLIWCRH